jgi:hypothetical protein
MWVSPLPVAGVLEWPLSLGYSRPPFTNLVAGAGALTAGPNGVALARFGWVDPSSGEVSNVWTAGWALGFVLPIYDLWNWQRVFRQAGALILRSGQQCVLAAGGLLVARFCFGAQAGQRVYADPNTGAPLSGNSTNPSAIATPWTVMKSACCSALVPISTAVQPLN